MAKPATVHWNGAWKDTWTAPEDQDTKRPPTPSPIATKLFGASPKTPPPPILADDVEYIQPDDFSPRASTESDLPPTVVCYPAPSSTSSIATYTSSRSSETDSSSSRLDEVNLSKSQHLQHPAPPLPPYRRASLADPTIRSSDPRAFGKLFPSLDRLSIRHDDRSVDGNLNLRVDTTVQGHGMKKRPVAIQLFHLVMYHLPGRDFSLLRYGPDSGREVCSSKRAGSSLTVPAPAMQQIRSALQRPFLRPRADSCPSNEPLSVRAHRRPSVSSTVSSQPEGDGTRSSSFTGRLSDRLSPPAATADSKPSKTMIKLEFSNYASVQLHHRANSKKYSFSWWGRRYTWRRETDKTLNVTSFHLVRDGDTAAPIAHIVPEVQSPTQLEAERAAGGWIPPCFMWISDRSVIEAVTDVADVIVATGLIALVDDSIQRHWPAKRPASRRASASMQAFGQDAEKSAATGRMLMNRIFARRHSMQHAESPLRAARLAST